MPNTTKIWCIVDLTNDKKITWDFDSEITPSGYLLNRFEQNANSEGNVFIPASIIFDGTLPAHLNPAQAHLVDSRLWEKFENMLLSNEIIEPSLPMWDGQESDYEEETNYEEIVQRAIESITREEFKKVVLARSKKIDLTSAPNLIATFFKLTAAYSNAFVSLSYHPLLGAWIGASPELLMSVDENHIFKTVALAGTQRLSSPSNLAAITWSHKEIEEQALVARYIINCFKAIRLREYDDVGPRTVMAGKLAHLQTDFTVDMVATGYPDLAAQMLSLLHPTSAVCGMPKPEALAFINHHEHLNRKLFAGFIGPLHFEGKSSLYVNLRCANVYNNAAILYAGAGITKDSNPKKELAETMAKMETIGQYFL